MEVDKKEKIKLGVILLTIALFIYLHAPTSNQYTWSDAEGYYMYLPALTIFGFADLPVKSANQFSKVESTGRYYDKYTGGIAIMEAPFFGMACIYAGISSKYDVDGYSQPFQQAILIAALFYAFAGLFILYLILRKEYSISVSSFTLACIYFGTNMFYYSHREPGMAHIYACFLWIVLIWKVPAMYAEKTWKNFFVVALIVGLLVFIRPSNAVAALFILFYDARNVKERFSFIRDNFGKYCMLVLPFIVLSSIQLLLWKYMLGETVIFSYNAEPGFIYAASPKIWNVLFHVHNGLFIYAPVLLFSVMGLLIGITKKKPDFLLIGIILFISTYIFASWWAWWFGGAYGHRCYVDLLPLFAIPMAYLFKVISIHRFTGLRVMTFLACILLIYYSLYMTRVYRSPWDGPNFGWNEFWGIVEKGFNL